jgi:fibronectin-binding autotransporter adhesin
MVGYDLTGRVVDTQIKSPKTGMNSVIISRTACPAKHLQDPFNRPNTRNPVNKNSTMNRTRHPLPRKLTSAFAATVCCALLTSNAHAGLADFESLQSSNPSLLFQYRFEGASDASRLADWTTNGYALQRVVGTGGGNVNDIQFVTGFDGVSQAYQPSFSLTGPTIGAGLNTISTVPYGTNVTVEAIVQMDDYTEPTGNSGGVYILSARNAANTAHRAYFLKQRLVNEVATTLGDNNSDSLAFVSPYTAGNWYYVAMTAEYDSGGNVTTVNLYRANLSTSQATIELVLTDNTTFNGPWAGTSQFGIGAFFGGNTQFMQGRIDNVALTGGILSSNDFQTRLDALYVAAPGCSGPNIVVQPANKSAPLSSTATFTVLALGTSPTYQWQISTNTGSNWDNVSTGSGGTTAGYTTPATILSDSGKQYRCIINVACNSLSVTSAVATLNVGLPSSAVWTGTAGDLNWNTASNWNILIVPTNNMAATISSNFTVNYSAPMVAASIPGLTNASVLNINTNKFIINASSGVPLVLQPSGMLTINSNGVVTITNSGSAAMPTPTSGTSPAINVQGGTLIVTNSSAFNMGDGTSSDANIGAAFTNNGGNVTFGSALTVRGRDSRLFMTNGTFNTPTLNLMVGGANDLRQFFRFTAGTANLGDITIGRASTAGGVSAEGGVVNSSSIRIGTGVAIANSRMTGGIWTNAGLFYISDRNNAATSSDRRPIFTMSGGDLTTLGSDGIIINNQGQPAATGISTNGGHLFMNGGTITAEGIQLNGPSVTANSHARFIMNGGTVYLGSVGLVANANIGNSLIAQPFLNGGTLGAKADWSSTADLPLGATFTFKAANAANTAHNITLSGVLSGPSAALIKTGNGTLTLNNANTYGGNTTISAGTLALGASGSLTSAEILLGSNTVFDVTANAYTLPAGKILSGFGSVTGNVAVASSGEISPGSNSAPATLTFRNSLTQSGDVVTKFDLSTNPSGPSNDLIVIDGDLTVSGLNTIQIAGGGAPGSVHPLFKYSGTFNGALSSFTNTGPSGTFTNITSTTPKSIAFRVSTALRANTNIVWVGNSVTNDWDLQVATNWLNGASLDKFINGDFVTFNAIGATHPNVNIPVEVQPGSVTVNAVTDYTFSGVGNIDGLTSLTKTNAGKLTLQNDNTFSGGVNFNGGTVSVASLADAANASPLGASGTLAFNGGALEYTGASTTWTRGLNLTGAGTLNIPGSTETLTLSGQLTGAGALTKIGDGTLALNNNANNYSGGTLVNAGILQVDAANGAGTNIITLNGGLLSIGAVEPVSTVDVQVPSIVRGGHAGGLSGIRGITGDSDLTVEVTTGVFDFIASMVTYSNTITMSNAGGATVRFDGTTGSSLATFDLGVDTMDLYIRNSLLNVNIGGLKGGPNTTLSGRGTGDNNGPTTYHIGANGQGTTFEGIIRNGSPGGVASPTSIVKTGTGKLTLTGNSTYTGTTVVSNGTLQVDGSLATTNTVTVDGGILSGIGSINGPVTVNAGGNLAPGASIGTLTINADLNLGGTFTAEVDSSAFPNADLVAGIITNTYGGTLVVSNTGPAYTVADAFQLFSAGVYQGTFASISPFSPGPGLIWDTSTLTTDGTLRIAVGNATPPATNITFTKISSSQLVLNWPAGQGWKLQTQTNALSLGLRTNWVEVVGATPPLTNTISPATPATFFRLVYP